MSILCFAVVTIHPVFFSLEMLHEADVVSRRTPVVCSVFTVSKGDRVFFGGNDDGLTPASYDWVDSGGAQGYGAIWVGRPHNVFQGVSEEGLAYDAHGLPRADVNPHLERKPVAGGCSSYPIQILRECATVEEVITWVDAHQWHSCMHDQLQFAGATGYAVVVSAGADGEVVYTRKPPGNGFLVSGSFSVANPGSGYYPCQRYETAAQRLSGLVSRKSELTAVEQAVPGGSKAGGDPALSAHPATAQPLRGAWQGLAWPGGCQPGGAADRLDQTAKGIGLLNPGRSHPGPAGAADLAGARHRRRAHPAAQPTKVDLSRTERTKYARPPVLFLVGGGVRGGKRS